MVFDHLSKAVFSLREHAHVRRYKNQSYGFLSWNPRLIVSPCDGLTWLVPLTQVSKPSSPGCARVSPLGALRGAPLGVAAVSSLGASPRPPVRCASLSESVYLLALSPLTVLSHWSCFALGSTLCQWLGHRVRKDPAPCPQAGMDSEV